MGGVRVDTSCAGVEGKTGQGSCERAAELAKVRLKALAPLRHNNSLVEDMFRVREKNRNKSGKERKLSKTLRNYQNERFRRSVDSPQVK